MKLNYLTKHFSAISRWVATALLCVSAISFIWQGAFISTSTAMANPLTSAIASTDAADRAQDKAGEDARRTKGFVRDTADRVEQTARDNARRVERATDNDGSYVERKAQRDAARIEKRAEEDTARTQKAIDNSKNAVQGTLDNVKKIFDN